MPWTVFSLTLLVVVFGVLVVAGYIMVRRLSAVDMDRCHATTAGVMANLLTTHK